MSGLQIFNALEAVFWLSLAALSGIVGHRARGFTRRRQIALTMFLAAFGVSDIWEVFAGSWWRPASLLILKAICLIGLTITAILIYRTRWTNSNVSRGVENSD